MSIDDSNSFSSKKNSGGDSPGAANASSPLSAVEGIKTRSDGLRGNIADGLADELTGGVGEDDQSLIKFHGIYQQDDRDFRAERAERMLEPDYSFMIRLRVPAGILTAAQWLAVDAAAAELSEKRSLRLTTRQTLQFHGVGKENLRPLLQTCARQLLDSIAACGDVNRNVMCSPHAGLSPLHSACADTAADISRRLLPKSRAYAEIWLGGEKAADTAAEEDALYGRHYLPRKFKIGIAVPPSNDVDVFSQDVGFVAVGEENALRGFNVFAGGGLGMTHGDRATYPRLGDAMGFCEKESAAEVAWHLAAIQRDNGDRSNRKQARFKYTVARLGAAFIKEELEKRLGFSLQPPREVAAFTRRSDMLGWQRRRDGQWDLGLFVDGGRIAPGDLQDALRESAALGCCDFLMTPNQNLMLVNVADKDRARIDSVFARRGLSADFSQLSGLRQNAMACVALPTCPLAFAESERYLPSLLTKLEKELSRLGLEREAISLRMTGCPNGCARPTLGEIGLVGKSPGRYHLYLGAAADGGRLSALSGESLDEAGILSTLSPLLAAYAAEKNQGESFGDFLIRRQHATPPANPADFHP